MCTTISEAVAQYSLPLFDRSFLRSLNDTPMGGGAVICNSTLSMRAIRLPKRLDGGKLSGVSAGASRAKFGYLKDE